MGGVKKVFKKIGGLVGLGGSETPKQVAVTAEPTAEPTATNVTDISADTGADSGDTKKKKRKGFMSTQVATDTLIGGSGNGRSTLG